MDFKPKKSLGQNFLHDPKILAKIADAADLQNDDVVLEVGPGTGNLTKILSQRARKIIAIEKDSRLIDELKNKFSDSNVEICENDILKFNPTDIGLGAGDYKIVANIPYYITSHFLRQVLEIWPSPKLIVLTIQKEVAQRIIAQSPHMNLLALSVQFYAQTKIVDYISAGSFSPKPKTDSAIIRITPKNSAIDLELSDKFFKIVRLAFSEKRKQLAGLLSSKLKISKEKSSDILVELGLSDKSRPENLSLENWLELIKRIQLGHG